MAAVMSSVSRHLARRSARSVAQFCLSSSSAAPPLAALDRFEPRHLGPRSTDLPEMLRRSASRRWAS